MAHGRTSGLRAVAYEDRIDQLVGLKLLLLSLRRHAPDIHIQVHVPNAPASFVDWIRRVPSAFLRTDSIGTRRGYDVKPHLLMRALEEHGSTVMWLDSDLIINGDIRRVLAAAPDDEIVVTEEPLAMPFQGGRTRSRAWGLTTARALPATTNTAVVRVAVTHLPLVHRWHEFLGRPEYQECQQRPWHERPIHMMGDQEVLCALLESDEFSHVGVHFLRRGRTIAHCFPQHGYMFHQMVANLATGRRPAFVHCHGAKPWHSNTEQRLHLDVSPYTLLAREYADDLDEPTTWMTPASRGGRRMVRFSRGNPWTASLPLAAYKEVSEQRLVRTGIKRVLRRD